MQIDRARPYSELPITARLATALTCFEQFCRVVRVHSHHVDTFLNYLWDFPVLGQGDFGEWIERQPPLVDAGLGDPFPGEIDAQVSASDVSTDDFRSLVENVTEIVHGSLYGAVENRGSLLHLERVLLLCERFGIAPPPPQLFAPASFSECHGWGDKIPLARRDAWRAGTP